MKPEELDIYINLIFEKEKCCLERHEPTWILNSNNIITYDHSKTLVDLYYNNSDINLQDIFVTTLCNNLFIDEEIIKQYYKYDLSNTDTYCITSSALSFFTLLQLQFTEKSLENLHVRISTSILIMQLLIDIFKGDTNYFNINSLHKLVDIINQMNSPNYDEVSFYKSVVKDYITTNAYELIKKEIKGVNIEINRDKETVINKIKYLHLDEKYNDFLNELDTYINTQSGLVASGMISTFRTFLQDLLMDLAKKISNFTNKEIIQDKTKTPISNARTFLKKELGLTKNDNNLIDDFINILHGEGGHSFTSTVEYFRLARNIGIEIVLLLLSKYEKLIHPATL